MITNRKLIAEGASQFYRTPSWGTRALLKYVKLEGPILEPCCGRGDMAEVLAETGNPVYAYDIADHGYGSVQDFFTQTTNYANIVTNPPYDIAEEILEHALNLATSKVCLLLRTAFLEGARRYDRIYRTNPPQLVLVFSQRLTMYPADQEGEGTGTTCYSWFVWSKDDWSPHLPLTIVRWIEPGLRDKDPNQTEMAL